MAVVLAVLCGLAAAYCLVRCVVPRWRADHGVGVDAWHVAMGTAMVAMLLAPFGPGSAAVQAAAFGLAALWCACHLLARNRSGAHVRLGLACAVMVAMLLPASMPAPASAAPAMEHHMPGMDMSGMAMPSTGMVMPPAWLTVVMLAALVGVVAAALLAARRPSCRGARFGLACEVVMATAMGWMVAQAL